MIIPNTWKNKNCSKPPTRKGVWNEGHATVYQIGYVHTVDGRNPAPVDIWSIPLFIGFNHPRWCGISSIHRISHTHTTCMILYEYRRDYVWYISVCRSMCVGIRLQLHISVSLCLWICFLVLTPNTINPESDRCYTFQGEHVPTSSSKAFFLTAHMFPIK